MMNKKKEKCAMLENFLKKFFIHCYSMNLQQNTISSYESKLKVFQNYIRGRDDVNCVNDITSDVIRDFLSFSRKRVSKSTVKHYYNTLNIFFKFLVKNKIISENIIEDITKPKVPKRDIRSFSNSEINIILKHFDKNDFVGYRNYAIMTTLFGTGMRISELCNLQAVDVMFELNVINIIGKGDKQRRIPISETLRKILLKYFKIRNEYIDKHRLNQSRHFFISRNTTPMTRDNVEWIFIKIKRDYNLQGDRFSPHTFRHTFAKNYLLNGGEIFSLQKILGHSKIETTKKYIALNDQEVKIQNDKFNPLDNPKWQYY